EQINLMREISSYVIKMISLERIFIDLDIVSTIAIEKNLFTKTSLIQIIQLEKNSNFIENKQNQLNFILNKQQKRIQQLKYSINILEKHLQQTLHEHQLEFHQIFPLQSNHKEIVS
ncbi:hypothetical protein I4U23_027677, partial [Adineta vaga]